ncbi:MAG TPA: hypothetical protein VFZ78_07170 [Flavisolibacter sp.]
MLVVRLSNIQPIAPAIRTFKKQLMWRFLPILLCLFACSRGSEPGGSKPVYLDSVSDEFSRFYLIDADSNNTMDLKLGWRHVPLGTNITEYAAVALHPGTRIHATIQYQPICRDTTFNPNGIYVDTHSCPGGPNQIRVDTFIATPNLMYSELSSTTVNTFPGDSFMVFKRTFVWGSMPIGLYFYNTELFHGFFMNATAGYLLFMVNGKRFAALLSRPALPFIVGITRVDP